MKRITFLAAFIVTLMSFGVAKAQVSAHIGINIGGPGYYHRPYYAPPPRVVVVNRPPVYSYPAYGGYYRRPVIVNRGYYAPRRVGVYRNHGYYGRGHRNFGHGRGHGRGR